MIFKRIYDLFQQCRKSYQLYGGESEAIISEKEIIRQRMKYLKKNLSEEQKQLAAEKVFHRIESNNDFIKATTILLYWSMPDELPTHDFIKKWSVSKSIFLPVVKEHHMTIRPFTKEGSLTKGKWNLMEPMTGDDYLKIVDLVIVPGVAFDRKKQRLGRGKGYYDKYFKEKRIKKWGICYDFQLYDTIPSTSFDVMMNKIFTPSGIIE